MLYAPCPCFYLLPVKLLPVSYLHPTKITARHKDQIILPVPIAFFALKVGENQVFQDSDSILCKEQSHYSRVVAFELLSIV
jgi:hypothetical protein